MEPESTTIHINCQSDVWTHYMHETSLLSFSLKPENSYRHPWYDGANNKSKKPNMIFTFLIIAILS